MVLVWVGCSCQADSVPATTLHVEPCCMPSSAQPHLGTSVVYQELPLLFLSLYIGSISLRLKNYVLCCAALWCGVLCCAVLTAVS